MKSLPLVVIVATLCARQQSCCAGSEAGVPRIWAKSNPSGLVFFSLLLGLNALRITAFGFRASHMRLPNRRRQELSLAWGGQFLLERALNDLSQEDLKPFSLKSTVMIDEQTQRKYDVLPPLAPAGKKYLPGGLANVLLPGEARTLSIQFASPPAPPLIEGREPHKQTVSFLLTGAKGPIVRVPLPPPSNTSLLSES